VRFNQGGKLRVPWGYVAGLQADPIEKKPFFHVLPGAEALTLACSVVISTAPIAELAELAGLARPRLHPVNRICTADFSRADSPVCPASGCRSDASSYNEPLITSEWAVAIFRQANQAGLKCVYVSNGNATPEVLQYLRPHLVGYKIDLKTMQDRHYRSLGGVLEHVLDTIRLAHEMGYGLRWSR